MEINVELIKEVINKTIEFDKSMEDPQFLKQIEEERSKMMGVDLRSICFQGLDYGNMY